MRISSQFHWLSIALVLVTAGLIGTVVYYGFVKIAALQRQESLQKIIFTTTNGLQSDLLVLEQELRLISLVPSLLDAKQASASRDEIETLFRELLETNSAVYQIRFIGTPGNGREVVRLERGSEGIVRTPEVDLQEKGDRPYFQQTISKEDNEVLFSEINLNRENGEIETPYRPTIRLTRKVRNAGGQVIGIVALNANFQELVDQHWQDDDSGIRFIVANSAGDYLFHPDDSKTFGFELGNDYKLQNQFPDVYESIVEGDTSKTFSADDSVGYFEKLRFSKSNKNDFLITGVMENSNLRNSFVVEVGRSALFATLALVAAAMVGGYYASRFLTQPLLQITTAVKDLQFGQERPSLPTERNDEIGVLAKAFDQMVLDLQQKQKELTETNENLETANRDLEHFTHLAAHDLREPLRKQQNLLELYDMEQAEHADQDEESSFLLKSIVECNQRMSQMITDFRVLTRVSEDHVMRTTVKLAAIIDDCLTEKSNELNSRNVRIEKDSFPEDITGYPTLLHLLYSNLIANAIQHTSEDGFSLHFTATRKTATQETATQETATQEEGKWVFGVRNTGSRIPESELDRIFMMFRTVDALKKRSTGVGLSLCKRIVDKHTGTMLAKSGTDESGTDFVHFLFTLD